MFTSVKVWSSCKSILPYQCLGPKAELEVEKIKNWLVSREKQERHTNPWPRANKSEQSSKMTVRWDLWSKSMTILNKYLHSNGNPITMTENVYKC